MSKSEVQHETQRGVATLLPVWKDSLNFVQNVHKKTLKFRTYF